MNAYLSASLSRCEPHQRIIVSKEKQMKHIANNVSQNAVRHYKIDGDVIVGIQTDKCDYLVTNDIKHTAYFIELKKPGDIKKAIDQIETTIELLRNELIGYTFHCRVVAKKYPAVYDSITITYKNKCKLRKGSFVVKNEKLEEDI